LPVRFTIRHQLKANPALHRLLEPWVDGPEHEAIRRHFIEERYRLMPHLYTTAEETSRTGLPIMRPLFLEFPSATTDGHPIDLDAGNEFLFGPSLLIAPSPSPEEVGQYEVNLPPGVWFDYWTESVSTAALRLRHVTLNNGMQSSRTSLC
jgi:alpha-glucosidase (family GH31 glycosyl hydrolase)